MDHLLVMSNQFHTHPSLAMDDDDNNSHHTSESFNDPPPSTSSPCDNTKNIAKPSTPKLELLVPYLIHFPVPHLKLLLVLAI